MMSERTRVALLPALVVAAASMPPRAARGQSVLDTPNPAGVLRTVTRDGARIDRSNPFFQNLGTNQRTCATCHVPAAAWTITPEEVQERFRRTSGRDPIFRLNDGSNSPRADVSTLAARRQAYSMLLSKGLIRVGLPIPAGAEFELAAVDDPYGFASDAELSMFRRPMPTTNLRFLTGVMWDGRESSAATGTLPIRADAPPDANAWALIADLMHQANGATVGHAEGAPLTVEQRAAIVAFELDLATAQQADRGAGSLAARGARGGALALVAQPFYVTINDVLGADSLTGRFDPKAMRLFGAWAVAADPRRAAIARGEALFNATRIDIEGVAGLNDDLGQAVIRGSCTSCHDTPNVGNHSVALPIDIGLTDESRRTPDMPLYTLRDRATGQLRKTTDPGRALITGRWKDIGKFKGPVLRGLAARPPFFHNGMAKDFEAVVDFYNSRFEIGFTAREKADLVAFLGSL